MTTKRLSIASLFLNDNKGEEAKANRQKEIALGYYTSIS